MPYLAHLPRSAGDRERGLGITLGLPPLDLPRSPSPVSPLYLNMDLEQPATAGRGTRARAEEDDDFESEIENFVIVDESISTSIDVAQTSSSPYSSVIILPPSSSSSHIHSPSPVAIPLILSQPRLGASFISILTPPLEPPPPSSPRPSTGTITIIIDHHHDQDPNSISYPGCRQQKRYSDPTPLLRKHQSTMNMMDMGVSLDIDMDDNAGTASTAWRGLRRALSLGSSSTSARSRNSDNSLESMRSRRLSRSRMVPPVTAHRPVHHSSGRQTGNANDDYDHIVQALGEYLNNSTTYPSTFGIIAPTKSKSKSNSNSTNNVSINTNDLNLTVREKVKVLSGPSSPSSMCSVDQFINSMPFPQPPSDLFLATTTTTTGTTIDRAISQTQTQREGGIIDTEEEEDQHTITIKSPLTTNTTTSTVQETTIGDQGVSPTDPFFPRHTLAQTSSSSSSLYDNRQLTIPNTPSPHTSSSPLSLTDSPVLTTPASSHLIANPAVTHPNPHHHTKKDVRSRSRSPTTQALIAQRSTASALKAPDTPPSTRSTPPLAPSTPRGSSPDLESESITASPTLLPETDHNNNSTSSSSSSYSDAIADLNNTPPPRPERRVAQAPKSEHERQDQHSPSMSMTFGETDHPENGPWSSYNDNQDTLAHRAQPPSSHPFHHKSRPSVPSSTRTTLTISPANSSDPLSHFDNFSSPPTYSHLSGSSHSNSRRNSKFTAFSGSSGSSIYSYSTSTDASSYRGHGQHWHAGERPDISTVFEEENSVDIDFTEKDKDFLEQDFGNTRPLQPRSCEISDRGHARTTDHVRYPHLSTRSSSNTPVSRSLSRSQPQTYFSRERSGTVSSQTRTILSTRSAGSNKSVHPFANAVLRPSSSPPKPDNFLSPQQPRREDAAQGIYSSKSSPNLAETYKMAQPTHQSALVSTEDQKDDGDTCPVCVESLSFTYRLPGEKPHIVPECSHALHEECFVTVYGPVPSEGSKKILGVCGVCRQPMKIVKGATRDKLATLMGGPGRSNAKSTAGSVAPSGRSVSGRQPTSPTGPPDPNADDPVDGQSVSSSASSCSLHNEGSQPQVVVPSISIRSEFPSIGRNQNRRGKQVITAMVTVEIPSAGDRGRYPAKHRPLDMSRQISIEDQLSSQLPPSPHSTVDSHGIPHSARSASAPDPFAHVVNDLRHRMVDYKNSSMDEIGPLRLFDLISVRKANLIREFHVYLFQEALICVSEEKKTGLRSIFSSSSSVRSDHSSGSMHGRGVLKLKGRIYLKHVKRVIDSSVPGELSLTISMEDETLESFILTFKDRSSHETWRVTIDRLIVEGKMGQSRLARLTGGQLPRSAKSPSSATQSSRDMSFNDFTSPTSAGYASTPATSMFSPSSPVPGGEPSAGDLAFSQPLGPIHTPIDLVIILSLPAPSSSGQLPLKVKLMKTSLAFVLALLGPRDRVSLVTCEMGVNGVVRKTPYLSTTRYESRKRLETFVDTIGSGRLEKDEFEVQVGREERLDVITAVNVALDVVLQRKQKNPLSGMVLISDTSDIIKRAQMDLVTARLDAANIPVHALGYGRSHDPSPLWMISNHTNGTYTFVKEWYHLRDSLAGVIGGLMSIALDNMKLHLSCQDNDFRVLKVSGTASAVVSTTGKDVDIELRELRHGEIREMLVELDLDTGGDGSGTEKRYSDEGSSESDPMAEPLRMNGGNRHGGTVRKAPSFGAERAGLGLDMLSVTDANALRDRVYEDALIDEVPVVEVDCSFHDPAAARSVARLAHPVLLTVAILPTNASQSSTPADPMIVRRRMELLASDMITRALLIASRQNFTHASRILRETKRIIETIVEGLRSHSHAATTAGSGGGGGARSKREAQTVFAIEGLGGTIQDLDMLLDGLEEHKDMFERDHRNYSAQQAGVLRAQRSWTTRTITERTYCTKEVQQAINLSGEYQSRS